MIVLGIDPGTAVTGYGVVTGDRGGQARLIECGIIRTKSRDPLAMRLQEIHAGVVELIQRHRPDMLSVEDVFYARNVRTTSGGRPGALRNMPMSLTIARRS